MKDLTQFIQTTNDGRELKRALAVKMTLSGAAWADVMEDLQVSHAFISKWRSHYKQNGITSLRGGYHGSTGYLARAEKSRIVAWLRRQTSWSVTALRTHLKQVYGVEYASRQSYYALLTAARLSWKKAQAQNPRSDPDLIAAKREEIQKK